ncbi:MAG: CHAP domain-containing protein [Ruminococcus sp.]
MSKRNEFLEFVKSQIGTVGGEKIRSWYNKNVGNLGSSKWPWCAAGISYSAAKCGLSEVITPTASSSVMLSNFKKLGGFKAGGTYTPKAGDIIIIFKWATSVTPASHVGVVEYVEGSYVHTIEFNSGSLPDGEVARWKHLLSSSSIVGYGVPKFPAKMVKIKLQTSYIRSQPWLDKKYKSSKILKTLKVGDKVEYIEDDSYGWSKVKSGSVTGYIQNTRLDKKGLSPFRKAVVTVTKKVTAVNTPGKIKIKKNTNVRFICSIEKGKNKGVSVIRYKGILYHIKSKYLSIS